MLGLIGAIANTGDQGDAVASEEETTSQVASEVSTNSSSADEASSKTEASNAKSASIAASEAAASKAASESAAIAASEKAASESEAKAASESAADEKAKQTSQLATTELSQVREVPSDQSHIKINGNVPFFTDEDITSTEAYEAYGDLDGLGRVTQANAVLGTELMPDTDRESISEITPTGWQQAKYANVSGGWLYNRSHLIGYQLTGENANPQNLMTGTRWFNVEGMLPFENYVANYIEENDYHVRYRVTPVFDGNNLLASGIYMEGFSIEDNGDLQFNIYIPNRQPGVEINYADGTSVGPEGPTQDEELTPLQSYSSEPPAAEEAAPATSNDISGIDANGNGQVSIKEAKNAGFQMPIDSSHWLYQYMTDGDGDGMVGE
ncbi:DNA/RNA non-specific endonuclease [Aerococcus agrisoli]|uniref:DNA/RNA non-specific endonuclease n=1 Tax=Aerococcus agrisoli TaxID=2487350 RepID=UPI00131533E7|nr:DNA/RNA non-specific endonuclease [Aerococcus agrisoli]